MASKKYTLIAGMLLATTISGFSQLAGVVDYKDSSKVPAKRMAQQNEWRNNSTTQSFPAKPRDMWQVGLYGGVLAVNGDITQQGALPGFDLGLQVRKALGYVISVRGQVGYGVTKGIDIKKSTGYENNAVYSKYKAAGKPFVANFRSEMVVPSADLLFSLNNLMFHKKSSKVNFYALTGYSAVIYKTTIDALKGSSIYDYSSVNFNGKRKDIQKAVKNLLDGSYETDAKVKSRRQNFNDGGSGKWQARHSLDFGAGLELKVAPKVSLGAEFKYIMTFDDYVDGYSTLGSPSIYTPNNDALVMGNLSINYNLGSAAKRVAPLWWLNPLGYIYSELSNPTIMKFPKPVLDDADQDGVTDQFDIEPNTPAGCPVDTKGKSRDTDGDGVPDCRDQELVTPTMCQPVNADGVGKCPDPACCKDRIAPPPNTCNLGSLPSVQFASGIAVNAAGASILDAAASQIKANPTCKVAVVGHGGASKREQQLSWDRVESVISYLVEKQGISRDRFIFKYGEEGDGNTVDLQVSEGEEGPNMVPAPHPQYRKTK